MGNRILCGLCVLLRFLGIVQVTVYEMIVTYLVLLRSLRFAALHALRTTGVEFASARRIQCRGDIALQNDPLLLCLRIRNRNRGKKSLGVGVQRVLVQTVLVFDRSPHGFLSDHG